MTHSASPFFQSLSLRLPGGFSLLASLALVTALSACSKQDESKTAGQQLDSAIARTEQAAAEAKVKAEQSAAEAKAKTEQTFSNAGTALKNATKNAESLAKEAKGVHSVENKRVVKGAESESHFWPQFLSRLWEKSD